MAMTKKEVLAEVAEGKGCLGKAALNEPVFVLRAQDIHAADLVEKWAIWAAAGGCDPDKVQEAHAIAAEMRNWPHRRQPS